MKIVFHPRYDEMYASDPAAKAGRMQCVLREVSPHYDLVQPEPASITDVKLVHTNWLISDVQRSQETCEVALLSVGGAIKASQLAVDGEPAFGLIRPPGHHASPDHCWGFCFFNNVAISIAKLRQEEAITNAVIVDIDLHFGDGTDNYFRNVDEVVYFHPEARDRQEFVDSIAGFLEGRRADVIAVSAGFDRHEEDWGGQLKTEDYFEIGKLVKEYSERACGGRRYGVLEGGYNHSVLGLNVRALVDGMC
jgi:acetoin utilization deacetylase AcuC-like enzyme